MEQGIDQGLPESAREFTYIDISAVDNSLKEIVGPRTIASADAPSRARQLVKGGDVLVSMTRPNLNAVALVPQQLEGAIASTGFAVLRAILLEPSWLYAVVQSEDFVAEMSASVKGALYPAIRSAHVHDYVMPVPPLAEQKRITGRLTKLLNRARKLGDGLGALPALIQQYRVGVFHAACTGRLVPSEAALARSARREFEPGSLLLQKVLTERRARWEADQLAELRARGKDAENANWKERYKQPESPEQEFATVMPAGWISASVGQCGLVQLGRQRSPEKRSKNFPRPYIRAANITEEGIDVTHVLEMEFPPGSLSDFDCRSETSYFRRHPAVLDT